MEVANHAPQTSVRRTPAHVGDTYTALENCTVHTAHCKFHISQCKAQSADAGVGQLKHPLQDHHSQVVVGAISLKFVKNNLHNIVLLPVLSSLI